MSHEALIPHLVHLDLAGITKPARVLVELDRLGIEVDELSANDIQSLFASPAYIKAIKEARGAPRGETTSSRAAARIPYYFHRMETIAHAEDARTAFAATKTLLAYAGMVEVNKHEVTVEAQHQKLLEALKPEAGDEA